MCLATVCLLLVACSGVSQQDAEQTAMTFVKAQVKFYSTENVSAINLPEYTVSVIESYRDTSGEWVVVVHVEALYNGSTKQNNLVVHIDDSGNVVAFNGRR